MAVITEVARFDPNVEAASASAVISATPRVTVGERVYGQLKRMIARGEFQPGAPLVVRQLAGQLQVSPTPVVEALRRLEHDGLVTVVPKWGCTVKEWSWGEIVEAYTIRRALEGQAAELFVTRATAQDKKRLVDLNELLPKHTSDPVRFAEIDVELHLHIARCTRFPRLYQLIENSNIERIAIFGVIVKGHGESKVIEDYRTNLREHRRLVRALLGKDPVAAHAELWRHVDHALEAIAKFRTSKESKLGREAGVRSGLAVG